MLKGNVLTIYIQSNEARPKHRPQAANCQLTSNEPQNARVQLNAGIRIRASFRNTCPLVSNRH